MPVFGEALPHPNGCGNENPCLQTLYISYKIVYHLGTISSSPYDKHFSWHQIMLVGVKLDVDESGESPILGTICIHGILTTVSSYL